MRRSLQHAEPVLLIGETGTGKTTVCQLLAYQRQQHLHIINCNQHTEASDFLGSFRPARCCSPPAAAVCCIPRLLMTQHDLFFALERAIIHETGLHMRPTTCTPDARMIGGSVCKVAAACGPISSMYLGQHKDVCKTIACTFCAYGWSPECITCCRNRDQAAAAFRAAYDVMRSSAEVEAAVVALPDLPELPTGEQMLAAADAAATIVGQLTAASSGGFQISLFITATKRTSPSSQAVSCGFLLQLACLHANPQGGQCVHESQW